MHAHLVLALVRAAVVTVASGPEDGCPSAAQVRGALAAHAPRLVAPRPEDDPAGLLTLHLLSAVPGKELSFSLLDSRGRVRLYRALPAPPPDKARECAALAATVALIVDRYFAEVEIPALPEKRPPPLPPSLPALPEKRPPPLPFSPPAPAPAPIPASPSPPPPLPVPVIPSPPPLPPPAPPPPPVLPKVETKPRTEPQPKPEVKVSKKEARVKDESGEAEAPPRKPVLPLFTLSASAGRRLPGGPVDLGGIEFKLAIGAKLTTIGKRGGHLWAELSGGIIGVVDQPWEHPNGKGNATVIRSGGDLALLAAWPLLRGRIYVGPVVAIESVWLEASYADRVQHEIRAGMAAGGRMGYQLMLGRRFFARADLTGCIALLGQRVVTQSKPDQSLLATPPGYATFSAGLGIWFQ